MISSPSEELADARIVTRKDVAPATTGYFARDVFDLLTIAEPRLASTRWGHPPVGTGAAGSGVAATVICQSALPLWTCLVYRGQSNSPFAQRW